MGWSVTLVFVVVELSLLLTSRKFLPWIAVICGCYVVFLAISVICSWFTIPAHRRVRPTMPKEFQRLKLGPSAPETESLLSKASCIREGRFCKKVHMLYQLEQPVAEGRWRCQIEVVSGTVLAYSIAFKSSDYIMMDETKLHGEGCFLFDAG